MINQDEEMLSSIRYAMASSNLPMLIGSQHEIEIARNIRIDMLIEANDIIAGLHKRANEGDAPCDHWGKAVSASRQMRGAASAAWWVARRDISVHTLLNELGS